MAAKSTIPEDFRDVYSLKAGNVTHLAEHYGAARGTIRTWRDDLGLPRWEVVGASVNPYGKVSARLKPVGQVLPARVDGWKRPPLKKPKKQKSQLIVVCGDVHAPKQDNELEKKFESWLATNQPDRAINLGDLAENAGTSRWRNRPGQPSEQECVDGGYRWLKSKIHASPDTEWDWIEGNHDLRTEQYTADNAPVTAGLARAETAQPVLAVEHLYRLDELRVKYHRGYPLAKVKLSDHLVIAHGGAVKKGAGASALANLEKRGFSIVTGHTHRLAIVFKTVLDSDDSPSTLCGAETGTMKKIEPESFDVAPDHQNGFVTITLFPDGQFHIEPALYSGGTLRWRDQRY